MQYDTLIRSKFILEREREAKLLLDKIIVDPNELMLYLQHSKKDIKKLERNSHSDEMLGENFRQLLRTSMDVSTMRAGMR